MRTISPLLLYHLLLSHRLSKHHQNADRQKTLERLFAGFKLLKEPFGHRLDPDTSITVDYRSF
jgi:hypothetical protein